MFLTDLLESVAGDADDDPIVVSLRETLGDQWHVRATHGDCGAIDVSVKFSPADADADAVAIVTISDGDTVRTAVRALQRRFGEKLAWSMDGDDPNRGARGFSRALDALADLAVAL
jgi:hypothetical protein